MASSLCIVLLASAAIVGAIPRYGLESSYTMDVFNRRDEALSMQAEQTCPISGAHEVCQTAQMGLSGSFHICQGDGPCDPVKPCFYSRVCRCHPTLLTSSLLKCNSTTTFLFEGTFVVTHNILITPGTNVPNETCFTVDPDIESCNKECDCTSSSVPDLVCINRTSTGDESSCTAELEGCQCKPEFAPPDCCNCSRNFFGDNCENEICEGLCGPRPNDPNDQPQGPCLTCSRPLFTPPTCCNCTEGYTRFDFECKCTNGTNANGSCEAGFEGDDCCQCSPDYYKNPNGTCTPFCANNTVSGDSSSCTASGICDCKAGYAQSNCCSCAPDHYKHPNGSCLQFCTNGTVNGDESNCTAEGCQCKRGYAPPDCCKCDRNFYGPNCENEVCEGLCSPRLDNQGPCLTCTVPLFTPPTCCNCPEGYTRFDFQCKCTNGTNANGSCRSEFGGDDCCQCSPDYYKNPDGTCTPFCRENTETGDSSSCSASGCKCKKDYAQPDCCERICNINQNLFFLLDGSEGNDEFCPMAIVIHMLVAAFNPTSSTSGTKLSTVLFHNSAEPPSVVFGLEDNCTIIQDSLKELQRDYQRCGEDDYDHYYPSICGLFSRAVDGLEMIRDLIPANQPGRSRANALVIMTDGVIDESDNINEPKAVLNQLKTKGVSSILVAAVDSPNSKPPTLANLKEYTISNNEDDVIIRKNVIDVGIAIVRRMEDTQVICKELADNVTQALKDTQDQPNVFKISTFCPAQRVPPLPDYKDHASNNYNVTKYPDCGGSLSLAYEPKPKPKPNRQQMESANLEEEILAAVESVLENYKG